MNALDYADQASDIFVMSDSFIRIKELIADETSTIDDISDVILLDPALTGSILKLANSSLFNYAGKIDTVSKAVLVLGITEVYNLVIAYFTKEALITSGADNDFLDNYWCQSVDCALLLKFLGSELKVPNAERLFVLGLLHNLGELIIQKISPEKIPAVNDSTVSDLPWEKQQDILGFGYAECTAELLKLWQLPFSLVDPVRNQDNDDFVFSTMETKLLYCAKRIMLLNYQCKGAELTTLLSEDKMNELDIDEALIAKAHNFCDLERLSILAVLSPSAAAIY